MAFQSVARSESVAAFVPELERLIAETMDEWKVPGLADAMAQKLAKEIDVAENRLSLLR